MSTGLDFPLFRRAEQAGVLDGASAVIVASTATGKSYIGQEAIARAIGRGERGPHAYLVPFRSLAVEVRETLETRFAPLGSRVLIDESALDLLPTGVVYHPRRRAEGAAAGDRDCVPRAPAAVDRLHADARRGCEPARGRRGRARRLSLRGDPRQETPVAPAKRRDPQHARARRAPPHRPYRGAVDASMSV